MSANHLPIPLQNQVAITVGSNVYVAGGKSSGVTSAVWSAAISTQGALGAWQTLSPLPQPLFNHAGVGQGGYLMILGGENTFGAHATVYSASTQAGGALGAWSATTPLPQPLYDHAAVAAAGYVWVLGGFGANHAARASVYVAAQQGGLLGAWTAGTPLPIAEGELGATVANGVIYVAGGHAVPGSGGGQAGVYAATIGAGGSLGAWTSLTPLPQARWDLGVVAAGGYLWVIGGYNGSGVATATVYRAPINPDGTIGAWHGVAALPKSAAEHTVSTAQGYLFASGGKIGASGSSAAIYAAALAML